MNKIPIESLSDVARLFGDHSFVGPLARAWHEAHAKYIRGKKGGAKVRQLKEACLNAVAFAGNTATFVVDTARARSLRGEIFPPGCGPRDKMAA